RFGDWCGAEADGNRDDRGRRDRPCGVSGAVEQPVAVHLWSVDARHPELRGRADRAADRRRDRLHRPCKESGPNGSGTGVARNLTTQNGSPPGFNYRAVRSADLLVAIDVVAEVLLVVGAQALVLL